MTISEELQDARSAKMLLRNAGAEGETLVELVEHLVSRGPNRPKRTGRDLRRRSLARAGDLVPVAVDLDPLTNCSVVLKERP